GFRVELGEIETRLSTHPDIEEAVVLARESKDGENFLCAYYVIKGGRQPEPAIQYGGESHVSPHPSESALIDYLFQYLPDYMIPSFFIELERIPLTPHGKIDGKALSRIQISNFNAETYAAPRNNVEKKLVTIWGDILELQKEEISIDEDFFRIGGHSLKATVLAARVHKEFNVKLSLADIFKYHSIRTQAKTIKGLTRNRYVAIEAVEKKEYYILSSAQKRLYILQQMETDSTAYNVSKTLPLADDTDTERLEETFKELIRRHESLRTTFRLVGEQPVQIVHENVDFEIKRYKDMPDNFFRTFDLSQAPLLRIGIVDAPVDETANPVQGRFMLIDMHHIATDAASQDVLIKEFNHLNKGETLAPLKLQYKDYAEWQAGSDQKKLMKQQEKYWLNRFSDELPALNLPYDYPRPLIQSFEGRQIPFGISKEEIDNLKETTEGNETTLYMTILAIFTILLSKLSGRQDIVVGMPIAGRRHAELENIIGMFVNTLAMRNYPQGEKTF
ncbi:MAG: non-ribosomal peptide synthetase, partial [bacterium]|nr:non-ribosomal peptide synthetase [bacterium]